MEGVSLFSGIGGFELGLGSDVRLRLLNELDSAAQSVLEARFPATPLIPDVESVSARHAEGADLLFAGFPCQDVSIMGGQRGLGGEKSGLVRHVFRLAEAIRPERILLENVQSIRFVHGGRVLSYLMFEAERLGYAWAYRILDSRAFGLPQRRRRFYFLASRVDDPREVLLSDAGDLPPEPRHSLDVPLGFYWTEGRVGHGLTVDAIPPLKAGSALGIPSPPAVLLPDGRVVVPTIETAEILQGFPAGWTAAAPMRERWRLVGNAVSPPVLTWLARRFEGPDVFRAIDEDMPSSPPWPIAAWGDGSGHRRAVALGEGPSDPCVRYLSRMSLEWTGISDRALSGFVRRARESSLRYPPGFVDALEHARAAMT